MIQMFGERFVKKSDLIKSINEINDKICKLVEPNIQEVIRQYISNTSKYELVKSKDDIKGSVGFYMVFSSNRTFTKKACKIKHNGSDFYCVYRGHSYNTKERLISHLFYEQNSKYPNCMKIEINSKFYNINIGKKELYPETLMKLEIYLTNKTECSLIGLANFLKSIYEKIKYSGIQIAKLITYIFSELSMLTPTTFPPSVKLPINCPKLSNFANTHEPSILTLKNAIRIEFTLTNT